MSTSTLAVVNAKADAGFEPGRHLTKVGGKDYLEVKWRLVWLRDTYPDAVLETEPYEITPEIAMFRCRITLPSGGVGTGFGSETPRDFGDYIEKAETKAIGRALGALGFGTQFAPDHDFGSDARNVSSPKIVDSPVSRPTPPGKDRPKDRAAEITNSWLMAIRDASTSEHLTRIGQTIGENDQGNDALRTAYKERLAELTTEQEREPRQPPREDGITEAQIPKLFAAMGAKLERDVVDPALHALAWDHYERKSLRDLSKREASDLIDWIEERNREAIDAEVAPLLARLAADAEAELVPLLARIAADTDDAMSDDEMALAVYREQCEAAETDAELAALYELAGNDEARWQALAETRRSLSATKALEKAAIAAGMYTTGVMQAIADQQRDLRKRAEDKTR